MHIQTANVATAQCRLLHEWAVQGQLSKGASNPTVSKEHLRNALENIKPQIFLKLEAIYAKEEVLPG
jgi:eukaryotic-like serine/threonine-protein kinase